MAAYVIGSGDTWLQLLVDDRRSSSSASASASLFQPNISHRLGGPRSLGFDGEYGARKRVATLARCGVRVYGWCHLAAFCTHIRVEHIHIGLAYTHGVGNWDDVRNVLFVALAGNGTVVEVPLANATQPSEVPRILADGFALPFGLAFHAPTRALFVSDRGANTVTRLLLPSGAKQVVSASALLDQPTGLAFDTRQPNDLLVVCYLSNALLCIKDAATSSSSATSITSLSLLGDALASPVAILSTPSGGFHVGCATGFVTKLERADETHSQDFISTEFYRDTLGAYRGIGQARSGELLFYATHAQVRAIDATRPLSSYCNETSFELVDPYSDADVLSQTILEQVERYHVVAIMAVVAPLLGALLVALAFAVDQYPTNYWIAGLYGGLFYIARTLNIYTLSPTNKNLRIEPVRASLSLKWNQTRTEVIFGFLATLALVMFLLLSLLSGLAVIAAMPPGDQVWANELKPHLNIIRTVQEISLAQAERLLLQHGANFSVRGALPLDIHNADHAEYSLSYQGASTWCSSIPSSTWAIPCPSLLIAELPALHQTQAPTNPIIRLRSSLEGEVRATVTFPALDHGMVVTRSVSSLTTSGRVYVLAYKTCQLLLDRSNSDEGEFLSAVCSSSSDTLSRDRGEIQFSYPASVTVVVLQRYLSPEAVVFAVIVLLLSAHEAIKFTYGLLVSFCWKVESACHKCKRQPKSEDELEDMMGMVESE